MRLRAQTTYKMDKKTKAQALKTVELQIPRSVQEQQKELLNGPQTRLDKYEKRGIEATKDMLKVLKAATFENQRLYMLLVHLGVSQEAIDNALSSNS
ncbi:hypothetical protein TruAng_011990 [Truncatella angustata]|nr:hypothetical protein TruAng_011990 [Truncatella angustata]